MNRQVRGFTLIEILVVISILGVLMALVSVLVIRARSHSDRLQTEQLVTAYLPNAIERYKQEFKRLPPMTLKELTAIPRYKGMAIPDNSTNECSEVLLVALRHPDFSAPLGESDLPVENPFQNTDRDIWNKVPDGTTDVDAFEIVDTWGNPVVYIHKNAYKDPVRIINAEGDEIEVFAVKKPDGSYYNPTTYQIISVGEDGQQDSTEDPDLMDDAMNFKVRRQE